MGDADRARLRSRCGSCSAGGNGGYLKTSANGRYIKSTERHERILLNLCEAMGVTQLRRLRRPEADGAAKTPLPNIAA